VREGADWFETRLTVDHGQVIRAELTFRSAEDGSFVMAEKLLALTDATTAEIATGLVGILNDPHWIYEHRRRRVDADGKRIEVSAACGQKWSWENINRITVDDALSITSARPLRAGYSAAERAERGRVTDQLVLNHLPGERSWSAGSVISDYQVVVRCAESQP
jgi:hypothetical protein